MPDVAVLPRTAQEVSGGRQARQPARHPGRPARRRHRALRRRGAAARRHPRRRQADEPDPRDRPRGPHGDRRAGHQHAQAQRGAQAPRRLLSRRPGVVPVLAGRRADRHRRLVAARRALRPHARQRDLDGGRAADRRDRRDRRRRRAQAAQVLDRAQPQAAVHRPPGHARHLHGGDARAGAAAGDRVRRLLRVRRLHEGVGDDRRAGQVGPGHARRASCCSTSGRSPTCAATTRPTSSSRRGQGGGRRRRDVRPPRGGRAGVEDRDGARPQRRRQVPRRRDLAGRLGLAPRPLRDPAARPHARGPGRADVVALRGRGAQLLRAPAGARGVARDRRALPRALRHLRRLGDVRLHQRALQAVGRLPGGDRRRASGSSGSTTRLGRVGRTASARSPR